MKGKRFIGLMSGTSMDSLDAALVDFSHEAPQLLATAREPIPSSLRESLLALCASYDAQGRCSRVELQNTLDHQLAESFAQLVARLLSETALHAEDIAAIGSHGQTVFHLPPQGTQKGFSLQITNAQFLANRSGIAAIGDFRNADMQAGGHGAPLVPGFHRAIFHSPHTPRVIVNIGGIANITVLPTQDNVTGFDTGPGNVLMDGWIQRHAGHAYDREGRWAASGEPDHQLLHLLLQDSYFAKVPPKSTGRELFNLTWLDQQLGKLHHSLSPVNVQATLALLTAESIAEAIRDYAPRTQEIFVCGGGAHNTHLMKLLKQLCPQPVESSALLGLHPDWVEAMAFAWLAKQHLEGKPGNLPEVTGAERAVVLGKLFRPKNA